MSYKPLNTNISDQTNICSDENIYFLSTPLQTISANRNAFISTANPNVDAHGQFKNSNFNNNFDYPPIGTNYPPAQIQATENFAIRNFDIISQQREYVISDTITSQKSQQYVEEQDSCATKQSTANETDMKVVIHKVQFVDTLDGLSLQYGVSKVAIRKFNNLEDDNIYFLKTLKIPNPSNIPTGSSDMPIIFSNKQDYTESYAVNYDQEELERIRKQQYLH